MTPRRRASRFNVRNHDIAHIAQCPVLQLGSHGSSIFTNYTKLCSPNGLAHA